MHSPVTFAKMIKTRTTHRERRKLVGMAPSMLRRLAVAAVAVLLVGCDSGGGRGDKSDTRSNPNPNDYTKTRQADTNARQDKRCLNGEVKQKRRI